jgi:uncharacterized membrane-anchored protein
MKRNLLILVLALQSAWLLGTVFVQERALREGAVILLETRPVDPRDLLRGDYVILNYKISTIPPGKFSPALTNMPSYGQTVWVALAPRGEFHEIVRAGLERFEPGDGEVILRAESKSWSNVPGVAHEVRVEYGLERYFVREGTGNPRGKLTVQAAVPASGRASIKQVFLDGKPYAEAIKNHPQSGWY